MLETATCHRSWCAENPGGTPNERLEFLGDAILGGVVCGGVLWVAISDYSRKPRFRARSDREPARHVQTRSTLPDTDAALLWTYTTHSA